MTRTAAPSQTTRAPSLDRAKSLRFRHLRHVDAGDKRSQLLGWLEHRNWSGGNLNRRARAWIARHACLSIADLEGAESSDLDVLLGLKRFLDRLEKSIHDASAVLLGYHRPGGARNLGRDTLDEVGFGHEKLRMEAR